MKKLTLSLIALTCLISFSAQAGEEIFRSNQLKSFCRYTAENDSATLKLIKMPSLAAGETQPQLIFEVAFSQTIAHDQAPDEAGCQAASDQINNILQNSPSVVVDRENKTLRAAE